MERKYEERQTEIQIHLRTEKTQDGECDEKQEGQMILR